MTSADAARVASARRRVALGRSPLVEIHRVAHEKAVEEIAAVQL